LSLDEPPGWPLELCGKDGLGNWQRNPPFHFVGHFPNHQQGPFPGRGLPGNFREVMRFTVSIFSGESSWC